MFMKKLFTLMAVAAMALTASAQKIVFDATAGKQASYEVGGFKMTYVDSDNKAAVDANNQLFGTAESYEEFTARFKTGAKSGSKSNITLTVPAAGMLKVYVRTASSSATDRNMVLAQNGATLFDQVIKENAATDYQTITIEGVEKKIFPVVSVTVAAGTVNVTYPTGALNFYCFEFVAGEGGGSGEGGGGDQAYNTIDFITFDATAGKQASYAVNDFKMSYVDSDNKAAVDANNQLFGTAESYEEFTARFKTGAKSGSKSNITLTIPAAGTLKVYVRTASSSATDRNMVLAQNGATLFDQVIKEDAATDYQTITIEGVEKKIFPVVSVTVAAGTVNVTYPTGALNFYGLKFIPNGMTDGIASVKAAKTAAENVAYNLAGQKVGADFKGIVVKNGVKMIQK